MRSKLHDKYNCHQLTLYMRMTSKDVKSTAEHYHSPVRIATSLVSGLWLGWGFPYYYKWVGPEALEGRSIMNSRSQDGCRSPRSERLVIDHVYFSTPISRNITLTTKVQWLLGFVNIKTVLKLHLAISEKSQRRYPQNTVGKLPS